MKIKSGLGCVSLALATLATALPAQSKRSQDIWSGLQGKIKHVVYLMMENHSFDNIAGYWDFHPDIDNLRGIQHCNNYTNPSYTIYGMPLSICAGPYEQEVPLHDPDHNFAGTSFELYETWHPAPGDVPTMGGFVQRESDKYNSTPGDASFIIKAYTEKETHTLTTLAKNFAFWDTYFAEHPGPTNVNRQFATSGSSCGMVDNILQSSGFFANVTGTNCTKSIFQVLDEANVSWKNYYETDIIDAWMYEWTQENAVDKLAHASDFFEDVANGTLPSFSYINPECCTVDSMHPTSNMAAGEQLIKRIYDTLRNSAYWENTLFILNFDEHGGFADHVPPPVGVPQPQDDINFSGLSDGVNVTYDFTRLGVRVPAFLISPWIAPNTLIHDKGTSYGSNSAYTHTSFLHFLQLLWDLPALNNRVSWAKTFEYVFLDEMRTDTPQTLPIPEWVGGSSGVEPEPFYLLNQDYSYYASLS